MNDITLFNKLTAAKNQGEYKIKSLKKTEEEVLFLANYQIRSTATIAYYMGQRLVAMKAEMKHGKFLAWLEEKFPLSRSAAYNYMSFYERCKSINFIDMEGFTIKEAQAVLEAAGIIEPKKPKESRPVITHYGDDERRKLAWEQCFELPPLNPKVKLKNHRFEQPNAHEIYLIRRDFNYPVKIADVLAPGSDDGRLKTAHQGMMEGIQKVLELYFQEIERIEEL